MEFSFNINNLLADTITKLDCSVTPARKNAAGHNEMELRSQLLQVINKMGEASSKAQGLYNVITTGRKLQLSDHILYIMKDSSGGEGARGTVVGILKIGHKKLFVYSHHGTVHEIEPLCVLDFYVHESRQRMGCGRKLFDYMLQDTGVKAYHLAIDKPSFKFSQFLHKHYGLRVEIPQVNNFVVFEGFFTNRPDSAPKRKSAFGRPPRYPNRQREPLIENELVQQTSYSGFGRPPLPASNHTLDTHVSNLLTGHNSRPASGSSVNAHSASVLSTPRRDAIDFGARNGQLQPISAAEGEGNDDRKSGSQSNMMQSKQISNRHGNARGSPALSRPSSSNILNGNGINLTTIGTHKKPPNINYSEPLLQRGTTSDEYNLTHVNTSNFNLHQDYQGRRGQLKVTSGFEQPIRNPFLSEEENRRAQVWQPPLDQESWTVFNNQPSYLAISKRNYTHTRLW